MADWGYRNVGSPGDALDIKSITVTPDPPKPGSTVTVRFDAAAMEKIEDGAYFDVVIKLGLVKLITRRYDIFAELRGGGAEGLKLSCDTSNGKSPIPKGNAVLTAVIDLPNEVPRAKFKVEVRAYTVDEGDLAALDFDLDLRPGFPA
ncbi:ML domain-containing protein [Kitasatospora sp. NPDC093558]|uniref:ML domain-containing protein n=1 Tax=Kitasatospora sp. NPDC093558 TaxID=3155201 RepID=UPI00342511DB